MKACSRYIKRATPYNNDLFLTTPLLMKYYIQKVICKSVGCSTDSHDEPQSKIPCVAGACPVHHVWSGGEQNGIEEMSIKERMGAGHGGERSRGQKRS